MGIENGIHNRQISEDSRRIAKNAVLLYFRMFLLMIIGLFTSRIVLKTLGIEDNGIYDAVGGVVTVFTFMTASVSAAISRYLTCELGRNDKEKLKKVFSTSLVIQTGLAVLIAVLVETAGMWLFNHRMMIPEGRMDAAIVVFHCSLGVLMVNLLSIPFNAAIIAHERMSAFAWVSLFEAVLKLSVAFLLYVSPFDKLKFYAVLMLCSSILVRLVYGLYCKRHFEETRGKVVFDKSLIKEMTAFSGWNFLSSGAFIVNNQGTTILINHFFGVAVNAARGKAMQLENIVKQFANNVIVAVNPRITKSYVSGDKEYSFSLVYKSCKYSGLLILLFLIPVLFEADVLLDLWLEEVPAWTSIFTRLSLIGVLLDLLCSPLSTLILATGEIRRFYLVLSSVLVLVFPITWTCYYFGCPPYVSYIVFISIYAVADVLKVRIVSKQTGLPVSDFIRHAVLPVIAVCASSSAFTWLMAECIPYPHDWLRLCVCVASCFVSIALSSFAFALSEGEREYVKSKLHLK